MAEEKKDTGNNIVKYWPIVVGLFTLAGVFFGMRSHVGNSTIHIKDGDRTLTKGERTLTEDQFNDLMRFSAIMNEKSPNIEGNTARIIVIEKNQAINEVEYRILYSELEGLESKVSREVDKLNDKINEIKD